MKAQLASKKEFSKRILEGLRLSYQILVKETAARNGSLVIERDGKVVHVPAKELLKAQENKK